MNKRELRALKQEMQEPAVAVSGYRACSIGFGFGVESFYGGGGGSVGHAKPCKHATLENPPECV